MAENLKNTVLIDDDEYNINAVYSNEAGKVTTPLTIAESLTTGVSTGQFNGSTAEGSKNTINYVPATGGKFTNPIYITPNAAVSDDDVVLTSSQINNRVAELRGAPICSIDTDTFEKQLILDDETDQLYRFSTIIGTSEEFEQLRKIFIATENASPRGLRFQYVPGQDTCEVVGITADAEDLDVVLPYNAIILDPIPVKTVKAVIGMKDAAFGPTVAAIQTSDGPRITSIVIPDCIKAISKQAFKNCKQLTKVTLFAGVESIGEEAFYNCSSLNTIVLPKTVTSVGKNAFANCSGLTINYGGTEADWNNININSTGNNNFKNATINYNHGSAKVSLSGPFIYICCDAGEESSSDNKMYIKLPGNTEIIEVSRGAKYLSSSVTQDKYTYEGLAEIIAKINKRLEMCAMAQ